MKKMTYCLDSFYVSYTTDWDATTEWIQMVLAPFIQIGSAEFSVADIETYYGKFTPDDLGSDPEIIEAHLGKHLKKKSFGFEDFVAVSDNVMYRRQGKKLQIFYQNKDEDSLRDPARLIREILYNQLPVPQWVELHAACVSRNRKAIAFGGPKQAGKTTLLCHLMSTAQKDPIFDYVSNDRVWVNSADSNVIGSPMPVLIGYGTMTGVPELAARLSAFQDGFSLLTEQWEQKNHEFSVQEIAKCFNNGITPRAELVAYIDLKTGDRPSLRPIDDPEKRRDALARSVRDKVDSYPNWLGFGQGAQERSLDPTMSAALEGLPVFELEVQPSHLRMATSQETIIRAFGNLLT